VDEAEKAFHQALQATKGTESQKAEAMMGLGESLLSQSAGQSARVLSEGERARAGEQNRLRIAGVYA